MQDVFCSTKLSWQGARCALPLHPSGCGSVMALSHFGASRTYRRSITRGRLRSPCTHRSKTLRGLKEPDQPCAYWMPPSCRRWIAPGGLSPPPNPARQTWRIASPPTPNHAQPNARLACAISWRRLQRDQPYAV